MNKTYLSIIFAVIMLMSIGAGYAAVGVGSWVSNNGVALSITNGDTAEFRFGITAVTIYSGKYSIYLYREGTSSPIYTYLTNVPTVDNGALGNIIVTPAQYNNLPGNYYVLINSVDKYQSDSFRLNLDVINKAEPLSGYCSVSPVSGTSPLTVSLNLQPSGGIGPYSYSWNYADGSINSNPSSTTHIYTSAGIYNVLVNVTDSQHTTATISCESITVHNPLTPLSVSCDANPKSGTTPLNVTFTSIVSGGTGSYAYKWTFADGGTSITQNTATHTYTTEGTYATTLTVIDTQNNNNQVTANCNGNIVVTKPIVPITGSCTSTPASGTSPLTTVLSTSINGGSGTYTYAWTFGDGGTGGNQNSISHIYTTGTYNPTVKVIDSNNVNNQATLSCPTITANKPLESLNVICDANPKNGNTPLNVTFTSQVSGGTGTYAYKWTFGDGATSITQNTATHTYTTEGTYTTKLTITDTQNNNNQVTANCNGNIVVTKPIVPVTGTCNVNPASGTSPLTTVLSIQPTGGSGSYSYSWTFGDTATGGNQNSISHTYTTGTYNPTVKIIDANNNNNQATISCPTITANKPSTPINATCSVNPSSGTSPLNVTLSTSVSGGTGLYSYKWTFGDGTTGGNQNSISHTYTTGTYTPSVNITDTNNNHVSINCNNQVNVIKRATALNVTCDANPKNGTASLFVTFTSIVSGGTGPYTYDWTFGDGALGSRQNSTSHTYANAGQYNTTLRVTDANHNQTTANCGKITANKPVTQLNATCDANPKSGTTPLNVQFTATATGGTGSYSYRWTFGDQYTGSSTQNQFVHTYTTNGTYKPTLTVIDTQNNNNQVTTTCGGNITVNKQITPLNATCSVNPTCGFSPLNVTFTSAVSGGTGSYTYRWTFADGTTGNNTQNQFVHTYTTNGTYKPTLTVIDTQNNNNQVTTTCGGNITVNKQITPINATCSVNPSIGYSPLTVTASAVVQGGVGNLSYQYTFGDGSVVSHNQNSLTHQYNNSGYYSVSLIVIDASNNQVSVPCGSVTVNRPYSNLAASCTPSQTNGVIPGPTNGTVPLNIVFNSQANGGTGIFTYEWLFGDGQSATAPSSTGTQILYTHIYNTSGVFNPSLKITDSANNTVTADCGKITANNVVVPTNLDVTCISMPNSGTAPLFVTFTSIVNNGVGPYTYVYDYGMGYNTTSQDNVASQNYITPGAYNPRVQVTDSQGHFGNAQCGLIIVSTNNNNNTNTTNNTVVANIGGPYTGYTNEAVTFDASASTGNIVTYRFDFGDGTVVDSAAPTIQHIYSKVNIYPVTLTVFGPSGNFNSASTTATIIDRTSYGTEVIDDVPDKGIVITSVLIYGKYGEIFKPNDELTAIVNLKNEWTSSLKNVRVTISIPELGIEDRSSTFDFGRGSKHTETLSLPFYNVAPGVYYLKIEVHDDQANDDVRRIIYREIIVKK